MLTETSVSFMDAIRVAEKIEAERDTLREQVASLKSAPSRAEFEAYKAVVDALCWQDGTAKLAAVANTADWLRDIAGELPPGSARCLRGTATALDSLAALLAGKGAEPASVKQANHTPPRRGTVVWCNDCQTYGTPVLGESRCGNCASVNTRLFTEGPDAPAPSLPGTAYQRGCPAPAGDLRARLKPGVPIAITGPGITDHAGLVTRYPNSDTVEYRVSNGNVGTINIASVTILEPPADASRLAAEVGKEHTCRVKWQDLAYAGMNFVDWVNGVAGKIVDSTSADTFKADIEKARARVNSMALSPADAGRAAKLEAVAEGVRAVGRAYDRQGLVSLAKRLRNESMDMTAAAVDALASLMDSLGSPVCDKCGK